MENADDYLYHPLRRFIEYRKWLASIGAFDADSEGRLLYVRMLEGDQTTMWAWPDIDTFPMMFILNYQRE